MLSCVSKSRNLRAKVETIQERVDDDPSVGLQYLDQLETWVIDPNQHVRFAALDICIKLSHEHPLEMQDLSSVIMSRLDDVDTAVRGAALTVTYNLTRWYPHLFGSTTELLHELATEGEVVGEQAIAVGILSRMALLRPDLVTPRVEVQDALREFANRDDVGEILDDTAVDIERIETAITVLDGGDMASRPIESDLASTPRNIGLSKPAMVAFTWFWRAILFLSIPILFWVNLARWTWKYDHLTPEGRVEVMMEEIQKLKFFKNAKRRTLYLRASMWPTAVQLLRLLPGATPTPEDFTQQTQPLPDDWGRRASLIRQRDGYRCRNCLLGGGPHGDAELHVDHAMPRSVGGSDGPFNLRTLCRGCHEARHARVFER
jgi:hypothetical protein